MSAPKRVVKISASAIKQSACFRRFYLDVIGGYTTAVNSIDIEYGSAVHLFIKTIKRNKGANLPDALRAAREYFRTTPNVPKKTKLWMTEQHLISTCSQWWIQVGMIDEFETLLSPVDDSPLVEQQFELIIFEDENLIIKLCGTMDDLARRRNGCYVIRDYKTTSSWDKEDYLGNYALSPQLTTYYYALQTFARTHPASIMAEMLSKGTRCMIAGIFLNKEGATFQNSEMLEIKEDRLDEYQLFLDRLVSWIRGAIKLEHAKEGSGETYLPSREGAFNGACEAKFGRCKYFNFCAAPANVAHHHLKNNFIVKSYDPLNY